MEKIKYICKENYIYIYIYVYICICTYIYIYVCSIVCIEMWIIQSSFYYDVKVGVFMSLIFRMIFSYSVFLVQ